MNTTALARSFPFADLPMEFERFLRATSPTRRFEPATAGAWSPVLDVEETDEAFVLHTEVPGVPPEDIQLSLDEGVLTVRGERRFYNDRTDDGFRRIERSFGAFHRAVRLPGPVDAQHIEATCANGVMTVTVPKAEEAKPRRIEVKSA